MINDRIKYLESQNTAVNMRTREASKHHRRKQRDMTKLIEDKSKDPQAVIQALHTAASEALNAQLRAEKQAAEFEIAKDSAVSVLEDKSEELQRSSTLLEKLQALCRELQKQNKQVTKESHEVQQAEAKRRNESVQDMTGKLAAISERLNEQQEVMRQQSEENANLRSKLEAMTDMISISDELRERYEAENKRLSEDTVKQRELAQLAVERYSEERTKNEQQLADMLKQQELCQASIDNLTKSQSVASALSKQNKELTKYNESLKQEYNKAASMLLETVKEGKEKDAKVAKLELANTRLQALCRKVLADKPSAPPAPESASPAVAEGAPAHEPDDQCDQEADASAVLKGRVEVENARQTDAPAVTGAEAILDGGSDAASVASQQVESASAGEG